MTDLSTIIESMAASVDPFMKMVSGFCYLVGINLLWVAVKKMNKIADFRARGGVGSPLFIPLTYTIGGLVFIYLPTFVDVATNTFFGNTSSSFSYSDLQNKYGNVIYSMLRLVNLAGLIWFVRGITLLVQASEPGIQHGPKGMAFMVAGIFALNIEYTEMLTSYIMDFISKGSL